MTWKYYLYMNVLIVQSRPTLCNPMDCSPPVSSVHGDSPDKNTGVGCHALLQGIFPTQGSNPDLPHCRQILYPLSHQGSPSVYGWLPKSSSLDLLSKIQNCISNCFFDISILGPNQHPCPNRNIYNPSPDLLYPTSFSISINGNLILPLVQVKDHSIICLTPNCCCCCC